MIGREIAGNAREGEHVILADRLGERRRVADRDIEFTHAFRP
jgi:hypothetical protein